MVDIAVAMLVALVALLFLRTWKGIGSRRVWLGGSLGCALLFLALQVYDGLRYSALWGNGNVETGDTIVWDFDWPGPWTYEYEEVLLFVALMFLLVGLFFGPKNEATTSLLGNVEGRILDA